IAAKRLLGMGVTKGTRVGLLCPNRLEWLPIAFGALRIGALLVPFSTLWKRDEIAYGLTHGDVALLLTVARFLKHDYVARLREIAPELASDRQPLYSPHAPALRRVVLLDDDAPHASNWNGLPAAIDDAYVDAVERSVSPTDLATIFFTSAPPAQGKGVGQRPRAL